MFKIITGTRIDGSCYVQDDKARRQFLHSDGSVHCTVEYWPTRELAQAVLDKYQPEHVWVHGDVFRSAAGGWVGVFFHLTFPNSLPMVFSLDGHKAIHGDDVVDCIISAKFLFNIKDKLPC